MTSWQALRPWPRARVVPARARALALAALALLAVATPVTAPAAAAVAAPAVIPVRAETFVKVEGHGWGHGVGMSQWGARGRALAGQTAEQIVKAYYTGSEIHPLPAEPTTIRVLVDSDYRPPASDGSAASSNKLLGDIIGLGGEWAVAGVTPNLPAGARLRLVSFPGQRRIGVHVLNAAGEKLQVFDLPGLMEVVPQTPTTRLQVWYKRTPPKDAKQTQFFDVYRGSVRVYINAAGLLDTVNVLGLEDYVRSVVPSEMPSHWPAEALRAQTLAVRTYGVTSLRPEHPVWDVDDTTNFQVYLGANHETGPTDAAVAATKNLAITYQGQPIRAYFFSTANGHTDANEDVFGGPPLPYLRPVADVDPSGKPWDWESPRAVWETKEFRLTELTPLFNTIPGHGLGEIRMLDFSKRTMSGRLRSVVATGSNGQATLSSWEFVRRFNALTNRDIGTMLSTRFTLTFRYPLTQPVPPLNLPGGQSLYFPQTGHNVRHAFLAYFTRRGGVAAFGLPLTEEFTQNGRTVQYFERARLEYHPEQAGTPFEVQLGLLGDLVTEDRRPFPGVASFPSGPEHRYFPETGHSAHFAFLAYFEANGGIARFGHPVSEEFTENGVTVQFFQRARLEYRPLQHPAQPVQEAHLGREYLRQIGLMG